MNAVLQVMAVNAACAAILATFVALAGRYVRRPAVLHALWILVLLQLFMPPVIEVGLLPAPAPRQPIGTIVDSGNTPERPQVAETRPAAARSGIVPASASSTGTGSAYPGLGSVLSAIWLTGSIWVLLLFLVRSHRFRRLLLSEGSRNAALERRLAGLAARMGVPRPALRVVRASISPLIRPRLRGAELLFPSGLLDRLDAGERDTILAHELAHIARRDHWVRLLELIAITIFWWHPAVWWARVRLHLAEERCCDQIVMQNLPHGRSSYARGLLKTVEFLAGTNARVPVMASGVGEVHDLKERLTMILKDRPPKSMSKTRRILLALCAASVLCIFPTWSERDLQAAPSGVEPDENQEMRDLAESEREFFNRRLELEQQALELERALRAIREQQAELQRRMGSAEHSVDAASVDRERERARAEAAHARAEEMHERARAIQRRAERERTEADAQRDQARWEAEVEYKSQLKRLELEQAEAVGDHDRAAALRLEIEELERALTKSVLARELDVRRHLDASRIEAELERLREERLHREHERMLEAREKAEGDASRR